MIRDAVTFAITLRSFSTLKPTVECALVPIVGLTLFTAPGSARAITGAVLLVPVARATDEDLHAATSTEKAADRIAHRRSENNRRARRQSERSEERRVGK